MLNYSTLENISIETLHKTFINAFSDYQIKIDIPLFKLQQMLKRMGYVSNASVGAFENEELIGFIFNGIRNWNGKLTSYDTGTAVIETHRKQGITSNMFKNTRQVLEEMGVEHYLLEVIETNTSAVTLYKKQGFKVLRDLECFYLDKNEYNPITTYTVQQVNMINQNEWKELREFWDIIPSWQNSIDSINALADTFTYSFVYIDNTIAGYGVFDKKTGDIPQIAVNKNYRRKGIGRSIVTDLISNAEGNKISVLNVDCKSEAMKNFLHKLGFEHSVHQYEMILEL